jgi:RNA polymerase sigma factor (sigma-70 family)
MVQSDEAAPKADPDADDRSWDAFARMYDMYEARLYRVACLLLPGQSALAEDAVAETFINVHRAWSEGRVDNFFGYARQALVNHVLGLFRRQQTAERYLALVGTGGDDARPPLDHLVVEAKTVFDALGSLPDRRRTAMVLRFYEDLAYEEIADLMAISVGAVKAHVFAGVAQLRKLLEGAVS